MAGLGGCSIPCSPAHATALPQPGVASSPAWGSRAPPPPPPPPLQVCDNLWEFTAIFGAWYTCNRQVGLRFRHLKETSPVIETTK